MIYMLTTKMLSQCALRHEQRAVRICTLSAVLAQQPLSPLKRRKTLRGWEGQKKVFPWALLQGCVGTLLKHPDATLCLLPGGLPLGMAGKSDSM